MNANDLVFFIGALLTGGGGFAWSLKLYGTQREHAGKLEVLERSLAASRTDHDTVVRLETEFAHVMARLNELGAGLERILSKLDEKTS